MNKDKFLYLLNNDLLVLGKLLDNNPNNISLEIMEIDEVETILVFTSIEALENHQFGEEELDLLSLKGRILFESFNTYNFIINPYSNFPTTILKDEIKDILKI